MKKTILLLSIFITSITYSQDLSEYQKIVSEINNPEYSLNLSLRVPHTDFFIVIRDDKSLPRKYYGSTEPCVELTSDFVSNKKIQAILNKNNILEIIYVAYDDSLTKVSPGEDIDINTQSLWVSIEYETDNNSRVVFLPISDKSISKKLINDLKEVFPNQSCFSELERK